MEAGEKKRSFKNSVNSENTPKMLNNAQVMTNTTYYTLIMSHRLEKAFLSNILFSLKTIYDIPIIISKFQMRKLKFTENK